MKTIKITFPWLSVLLAIILAGLFLVVANPSLVSFYQIPEQLLNHSYQIGLLTLVCLVILWDVRRFHRQRKNYDHTLKELLKAKKQLQNKAHTYSGHSDKLKLFISDRLLEYIQYDEKFLHFKNIASEVRHNGVICFDKVQTALLSAIDTYENNSPKKSNKKLNKESATILSVENSELNHYQEALNSMRYLWDLLDLSTTDNIALHIGNYLCECEEHYFQFLLQGESGTDNPSPYTSTFLAHKVLIDCLLPLVDNPEELSKFYKESNNSSKHFFYNDTRFYIKANCDIEMLGNRNHLRLLIENLVNNAQFYLKKKYITKNQAAIAIELLSRDNDMQLTVYNRGQTIKEEDKERIFQLGYSTRRKKENHGKGLGLYFVNSIVQGYEGDISFINISNHIDTYSLRIELEKSETITEIIETTLVGNQPMIITPESEELKKNIEWKISDTIKNIEVFSKQENKTYSFDGCEEDSGILLDPQNPTTPKWAINITKRIRSSSITFTPLDINGVKFIVNLPTAKARLDYSDDMIDSPTEDSYDNIIDMENQFKNTGEE